MAERATSDETIAAIEACQQELPAEFPGGKLAFGFDGVVDNVRTMVETRQSPTEYERLERLSDLEDLLSDSVAKGSSLTIEWEKEGTRTGGHACHLSRAFNKLDANTLMIGTYGQPVQEPFTTEFSESTLLTIGEPGFCDAVEFDDGKLMISETSEAASLDWEKLTERVAVERVADALDGRDLLGVGYWNVTSALPELLDRLVEETWPLQDSPPDRIFLDPGDIRNLPDDQIQQGAAHLEAINRKVPVTVSANKSETEKIAGADGGEASGTLRSDAKSAHEILGIDQYVGHGRTESAGISQTRSTAIKVPTTDSPSMTTSAGDHFNVGFIIAHLAGLSLPAAMVVGNAVAGSFVRNGVPPTYDDIYAFVDSYSEML
ncbi:hypothetical protein ACFQGE_00050 [Halomicroarcula sp. GCM10025817]|uniref:hypothetical protein n=1 Tax=Haloarcula TaxID=2237 RepID=UPI0023E80796|nr:hypothetical protein [Halomicroarcula sp. SYNS111]